MTTAPASSAGVERRVTWTFALVTLLAALGVAAVSVSLSERSAADRWEVHTLTTMNNLDAVLTLSIDLETGMRGYIFSGFESYLQPYNDARQLLPGALNSLGGIVADNSAQRARFEALSELVSAQLLTRGQVIAAARQKGLDAARQLAMTNGTKEEMDAVRRLVAEMRQEEERLLKVRRAELASLDSRVVWSVGFFAALSILSLGSSWIQIRRFLAARVRAERIALESAENLRVTLHSIGDGVLATDEKCRVTSLNPVAERLTGWSQAEAAGKPVSEVFRIINESSRKPVTVPVAEALRTGAVVELANNTVLVSRTGSEYAIADSAAPINDAGGHLLGAVLVFRDVTEEHQGARKLRASEALNRSVVEMAPYALFLQVGGRFHWMNPAGLELFHGTKEELLGQSVLDFVAPEFLELAKERIRKLHEGLADPPQETRFVRADRSSFWGRVAASPMMVEGQPGAVVVVEDITPRKAAEASSAAREVQLRAISDNLPDGAVFQFLMDERGARFTYLGSGIKALTGLAAADLMSDFWPLVALVPEDDALEFDRAVRKAVGELQPLDHTFRVRAAGGAQRWLHCRAAATRWRGNGLQWDGVVTDVTAARMAKEELRLLNKELEQRVNERVRDIRRFRAAIDYSPDSVFLVDRADMTFVDVNITACRLLGYSREELLRMGPQDIHPIGEDDLGRSFDEIAREGNSAAPLHTSCRRHDGTDFPVELMVRPLEGEDAGLFIAIARDTTAHKAIIESLRAREVQLNAAQSMAHIGSWEWDAASGETHWSPEMYAIYGVEPGTPVRPANDQARPFYHAEDWPRLRAAIEQTVKNGAPFMLELEIVRADGGRRWTVARGARAEDSRASLRLFGTVQDITERRQLEGQLQQAQKMEAIGRLAGGIAHDFNNLLTVINGYSDMLLARLSPEDPSWKKVSHIRQAGSHAAELTQQLLAFSRKQIIQPRRIDVNDVVRGFEPMLRRVIGEQIEIAASLGDDLGLVMADSGQLGQVLMNLAANAAAAMPDGGRFCIETANADITADYTSLRPEIKPGRFIQLTVSDTGAGMDQYTKSHLFEPFFTTRESGKGTGLGLATVYGIVKQAGGFIWVYSEPGEGTTFKIYLPRVHDSAAKSLPPRSPVAAGGTETILLVEDQQDLRLLAREILETQGYHVLVAADGALALEESRRYGGSIDLLLTDVVMPGISVRELAAGMKAMHPGIRVLFMSGYTEDAVIRRGISEASDAFIQKPFSPNALALRVREVLSS